MFWVDHAEIQIMTGRCWSVPRRPMRAIAALEPVLATFPDTHARDKALYLTWLDDAYLDVNEVKQACLIADRALSLSAGVRSTRPIQRLTALVRRLAPNAAIPAVAELTSRLAGTAPTLPSGSTPDTPPPPPPAR